MVDKERVCCLCGDVGFPQQLFRCSRCRFRFQHSYCSNYYYGNNEPNKPKENICDWCQYESGKNPSSPSSTTKNVHGTTSKRQLSTPYNHNNIRSQYTGSATRIKIIHHNNHDGNSIDQASTIVENPNTKPSKYNANPTPSSGVPSPRPNGHRRYKLLKDVMC